MFSEINHNLQVITYRSFVRINFDYGLAILAVSCWLYTKWNWLQKKEESQVNKRSRWRVDKDIESRWRREKYFILISCRDECDEQRNTTLIANSFIILAWQEIINSYARREPEQQFIFVYWKFILEKPEKGERFVRRNNYTSLLRCCCV